MEELKVRFQEEITDLGVEIISVSWRKEAGKDILQVTIDRIDGSVDLDLCATVSNRLDKLTQELITKEDYLLEICSQGAEKNLNSEADLLANLDKYVAVHFKKPINGLNEVKGYLRKIDEHFVVEALLKGRKKEVIFDFADIEKIHLSVKI